MRNFLKIFGLNQESDIECHSIYAWHPRGDFVVVDGGGEGKLLKLNRQGEIIAEIQKISPHPILSLSWDKDGDYLAVLKKKMENGSGDDVSVVPLWNDRYGVWNEELKIKHPTFVSWSKTGHQLAIGTAKGQLLLYDKREQGISSTTTSSRPVLKLLSNQILCGGWSNEGNLLTLCSKNRLVILNETGEIIRKVELTNTPVETSFSNQSEANTVSVNMNRKSILLVHIYESDPPMELIFDSRYGDIANHEWINRDLLLIGFSNGWISSASTESHEIGMEKIAIQLYSEHLITLRYNHHLNILATVGNDGIKLVNINTFKELEDEGDEGKQSHSHPLSEFRGVVSQLGWSPDGHILSIISKENLIPFYQSISYENIKQRVECGEEERNDESITSTTATATATATTTLTSHK